MVRFFALKARKKDPVESFFAFLNKKLFSFDRTDWAIVHRLFGRGIIAFTSNGLAIITEVKDGWGGADAETTSDAKIAVDGILWHCVFPPENNVIITIGK